MATNTTEYVRELEQQKSRISLKYEKISMRHSLLIISIFVMGFVNLGLLIDTKSNYIIKNNECYIYDTQYVTKYVNYNTHYILYGTTNYTLDDDEYNYKIKIMASDNLKIIKDKQEEYNNKMFDCETYNNKAYLIKNMMKQYNRYANIEILRHMSNFFSLLFLLIGVMTLTL